MEKETLFMITSIIYKTFTIIFMIIGTTTNILSAFVYSRKKMRKSSYSVYLFTLALVDLCVIINSNTRLILMSYDLNLFNNSQVNNFNQTDQMNRYIFKGFDIRETSIPMCRIHRFLTYFFLQLSSVILCMLSIDRFIGCVLVLKSSKYCKPSMARKIVIYSIIFLFLLNIHFLVFMGSETYSTDLNNNLTIIKIECKSDTNKIAYNLFWNFYFYIDHLVYCIVPFVIMFACNISIIAKIVSSRIRSKQVVVTKIKNTNQNLILKNTNSMLATEKRISIILIMISLSFFLFTAPVFVMEKLDYNGNPYYDLGLAISYMLMYLNHVINFFFYCSLGPAFRKEVKKLLPRFLGLNNKVDPLKISRYNTVLFASTSINPRRINKQESISNFTRMTSNNKLVVSYFKTTTKTEEKSLEKISEHLSVYYSGTLSQLNKSIIELDEDDDETEGEQINKPTVV